MTRDPFLDLLGDELATRASTASSQRRFGPEAVARGRRIRTRRRVASAALAVVAVVGIAGTAAAVHDPSARPVTPPASTTVPTPTVTAAPAFGGVKVNGPIDVSALPAGDAPNAPYVVDRRLVDGDRVVDLPFRGETLSKVHAILRSGDGWLLQTEELSSNGDATGLMRLHSSYSDVTPDDLLPASTTFKGMLGRADGTLAVILDGPATGGPTRIRELHPDGTVARTHDLPGDWRPVTMLDDGAVMLRDGDKANPSTMVWNLDGTSTVFQDRSALGGRGGILALMSRDAVTAGRTGMCGEVVRLDTTSAAPVASSCDWSPNWPSPEGSLSVAAPVGADELTELRVVRTEDPDHSVASFEGAFIGQSVTWEDASHFLVIATTHGEKDTSAVIRCSTDGRCERATDAVESEPFTAPDLTLGPAS